MLNLLCFSLDRCASFVNLVDLSESCKISICLQKWASMQPKTSFRKIRTYNSPLTPPPHPTPNQDSPANREVHAGLGLQALALAGLAVVEDANAGLVDRDGYGRAHDLRQRAESNPSLVAGDRRILELGRRHLLHDDRELPPSRNLNKYLS